MLFLFDQTLAIGEWDTGKTNDNEWFIRERSNIRTSGASCPPNDV